MTAVDQSATPTGNSSLPAVDSPSPAVPPSPAGSPSPAAGGRRRNRYIDVLRSVALTRVLLFHLFGWAWLPLLFPSMGVMFAFAGSLMAASLDRSTSGIGPVVRKRLRRLLPPLWAMGLVLVPIMLATGWTATSEDASPLDLTVLGWVFPLVKPPASDLGADWAVPLWYIRTYLWLMLLSGPMLWLWRHWRRLMMVFPFGVLLLEAGHILTLDSALADGVLSVSTYAACWMVGFYHHDGLLRRLSIARTVLIGALLAVAALAWSLLFHGPGQGLFNVSDIPMATALYNLGFTMILLRLPLTLQWVSRVPVLSQWVTLSNRRAMTIYLWGNTAIFVALWSLRKFGILGKAGTSPWQSGLIAFGATLAVLLVAILCLGWVEDVAGRRRPELLPVRSAGAGAAPTAPLGTAASGSAASGSTESRSAESGSTDTTEATMETRALVTTPSERAR